MTCVIQPQFLTRASIAFIFIHVQFHMCRCPRLRCLARQICPCTHSSKNSANRVRVLVSLVWKWPKQVRFNYYSTVEVFFRFLFLLVGIAGKFPDYFHTGRPMVWARDAIWFNGVIFKRFYHNAGTTRCTHKRSCSCHVVSYMPGHSLTPLEPPNPSLY